MKFQDFGFRFLTHWNGRITVLWNEVSRRKKRKIQMACKSLSFDINLQTTPLFIQCLLLEMFKYIKEISCKWSKQTSNFSFPKNLPEPKKDYLEIATTKKKRIISWIMKVTSMKIKKVKLELKNFFKKFHKMRTKRLKCTFLLQVLDNFKVAFSKAWSCQQRW